MKCTNFTGYKTGLHDLALYNNYTFCSLYWDLEKLTFKPRFFFFFFTLHVVLCTSWLDSKQTGNNYNTSTSMIKKVNTENKYNTKIVNILIAQLKDFPNPSWIQPSPRQTKKWHLIFHTSAPSPELNSEEWFTTLERTLQRSHTAVNYVLAS